MIKKIASFVLVVTMIFSVLMAKFAASPKDSKSAVSVGVKIILTIILVLLISSFLYIVFFSVRPIL
jgi:uncharacterized membrane protein YphA (DoxX/SURF4 family)